MASGRESTLPTIERIEVSADDVGWLQHRPDGLVNIHIIRPGRPTLVILNLQVKANPFSPPTATPPPDMAGAET